MELILSLLLLSLLFRTTVCQGRGQC